ncbi:MAG: fused MFS/spermidine synthase [Anaeromyxobacteraceae bacterium]
MPRPAPDRHAGTLPRTLAVLFFCSGFPALIYQLVWQRALFRLFGVNVESVTVIVTAFMLGLGLGSLAGGWLSRRRALPLLPLLAAIELLTAAFGLASPRLFEAVARAVLGASLPVTAAVALGLVLVPTLLMGATLPVLVGHLVRHSASVGGAVGLLYDVNTLGAGVACLVATVALFPFLGMRGALHAAVAMNVAVAAGALAVHLRAQKDAGPRPDAGASGAAAPGAAPAHTPFAALALGAASGLVALSYEVFFFRTVSYATGSSASAFAVTLFAFLVGLAAGSRRAARRCRASPDVAARGAVRDLVLASAVGWAFLPVLGRAAALGVGALAVALALVYLVARSWGVLFPTLAHLAVPADGDAGMGTARLYLANILGSATGSVLTGFVLMDRLALVALGQVLAAAGLACAAGVAFALPRPARPGLLAASAVLAGGALAVVALPRLTTDLLERLQWKREAAGKPRFARVVENRSGIIGVDPAGVVYGHGMYDGRFNTDLVHDTNGIFRAYALSLFHPAPRDVLVIGLSSGSWAQVVASHPAVRSVTIVEINAGYTALVASTPAVASLLRNPKVSVHTDDARRWLLRHPERRFDAVVANTTYHFRANASALLSAEFLALVRAHLEDGGVAIYNTTGSARVQRTGCLAFPDGLRFSNQLVVSAAPLALDFRRWRGVLEAYRIDGRAVLDLSREADRGTLAWLMSLEGALAADPAGPGAELERCPALLARTAGVEPVTDDNMGSEWRFALGLE